MLACAAEGIAMLRPLLFASAIVLFGITASSALGPAPQDAAPSQNNPVKATEKSQARAKEIYAVDCALCHGENGNGKTDLAQAMQVKLNDWTDPKTLADRPDAELFKIIRNGKDKMPAEADGRANDTEVWNLILYIRAMSKQQPSATSATAN
jgi:mono/diheme cytochrome c family protein